MTISERRYFAGYVITASTLMILIVLLQSFKYKLFARAQLIRTTYARNLVEADMTTDTPSSLGLYIYDKDRVQSARHFQEICV